MEKIARQDEVLHRTEQWLRIDPDIRTRSIALFEKFSSLFGEPSLENASIVIAPGRAEIIGNHTDYGGGETISANISRNLLILAKKRDDRQVRIHSSNIPSDAIEFSIDSLKNSPETWKTDPSSPEAWTNYIKSVLRVCIDQDIPLTGFDAVIESNIPVGAGVSSSAAIELATAETMRSMTNNHSLAPKDLARICKQAENQYVGMPCGYLDQVTEAMTPADNLLHIIHRPDTSGPFSTGSVPARIKDAGYTFLIGYDPTHERRLTSGGFAKRQKAIAASLSILQEYIPGITHTGEVTLDQYNALPQEQLAKKLYEQNIPKNWLTHVIEENDRVRQSIHALQNQDYALFGRLMTASGKSSLENYQLDDTEHRLSSVVATFKTTRALGTRMMGGGFSPTTISLVPIKEAHAITQTVANEYAKAFGGTYTFFDFIPSPSVGRLDTKIVLKGKKHV